MFQLSPSSLLIWILIKQRIAVDGLFFTMVCLLIFLYFLYRVFIFFVIYSNLA